MLGLGRAARLRISLATMALVLLSGCGGDDEAATEAEPAFTDAEIVEAIGFQERESLIEGQEVPGYESADDATCSIDDVLNVPEEVTEAQADPVNDPETAGKPGLITSTDESVGVTGAPFFEDCRRQIQKGLDELTGTG
jgi:hypothetical protein